ncbi:Hypothetical_protein [Hexamita inflata]|uniref:Hypothetical_protein n=1 Tax=Hexamita inflata TaxID=28002 RepID=A0AA86Q0E0_9EUKA|nr:Hypothetical protein HINF_LOCUS36463 [Hexamita inflata]
MVRPDPDEILATPASFDSMTAWKKATKKQPCASFGKRPTKLPFELSQKQKEEQVSPQSYIPNNRLRNRSIQNSINTEDRNTSNYLVKLQQAARKAPEIGYDVKPTVYKQQSIGKRCYTKKVLTF